MTAAEWLEAMKDRHALLFSDAGDHAFGCELDEAEDYLLRHDQPRAVAALTAVLAVCNDWDAFAKEGSTWVVAEHLLGKAADDLRRVIDAALGTVTP